MFVGKAYLAGSWGRKLWNAFEILFMKINEGINTCSWGCKFVARMVHKIHKDDSTVN
jgi:hypothetical protein